MKDFMSMGTQVMIRKDFAKNHSIKRHESIDTFKSFRVYCWQWPDAFTLQIRIPTELTIKLASVNVTIEEVEELLTWMKQIANREGR